MLLQSRDALYDKVYDDHQYRQQSQQVMLSPTAMLENAQHSSWQQDNAQEHFIMESHGKEDPAFLERIRAVQPDITSRRSNVKGEQHQWAAGE